jgi:hypothetical protein
VEERPLGDGAEFVVVTGMLGSQTPFRSHGHTVRLMLRPSDRLNSNGS